MTRHRAHPVDGVNRATWADARTLDAYAGLEGWTDPGERAALAAVASSVRGRPVLDLGAGAGRLSSMLRLLSDDYTAVDYTAPMVHAFRRNHPDLRAVVADGRHLPFDTGRFGLVVFAFNGVDAVDQVGRRRVLAEMCRVTAPDGRIVLSTHNLRGPSVRVAPWRRRPPSDDPAWYRWARAAARMPTTLPAAARGWRNWARYRSLGVAGDGWAVRLSDAHDFAILMHYVELETACRQVVEAGFADVVAYDSEAGRPIAPGADVSEVRWFHLVARRPS